MDGSAAPSRGRRSQSQTLPAIHGLAMRSVMSEMSTHSVCGQDVRRT
jgi:hypothetical protein